MNRIGFLFSSSGFPQLRFVVPKNFSYLDMASELLPKRIRDSEQVHSEFAS
jgi:hypothetical protein